jgi:hypothetical protein
VRYRSFNTISWSGGLALLACLALTAPGAAEASDASADATKTIWFAQIDKDGDGAISAAELDAMRTWRFMRIDLNSNRILTIEEFMHDLSNDNELLSERRRTRFAMMDEDQDGRVTLQEYIDFGTIVMALLDQDGDRLIRLTEFSNSISYPQ